MTIRLHDILEGLPKGRSFVKIPFGGTESLDFDQRVYPAERVIAVTTSRYLADRLRDRGIRVETTIKFVRAVAHGADWDCIVVLGAATVGGIRTKINKALRMARARGSRVVIVSSRWPDPESVYAVASVLGQAHPLFGRYSSFIGEYFVVQERGWGPAWVRGVKPDKLDALRSRFQSIVDERFDPASGAAEASLGLDRSGPDETADRNRSGRIEIENLKPLEGIEMTEAAGDGFAAHMIADLKDRGGLQSSEDRGDLQSFTQPDLDALAVEIHAANVAAGWWDAWPWRPDRHEVAMMLVISELAEAMEGDRKSLQDDHLPHRAMFDVELADAIIRLLDLAGAYGMQIAWTRRLVIQARDHYRDVGRAEQLYRVCRQMLFPAAIRSQVLRGIVAVLAVAYVNGIDIWPIVAEKRAYNAQRADHKRENRAAAGGKAY